MRPWSFQHSPWQLYHGAVFRHVLVVCHPVLQLIISCFQCCNCFGIVTMALLICHCNDCHGHPAADAPAKHMQFGMICRQRPWITLVTEASKVFSHLFREPLQQHSYTRCRCLSQAATSFHVLTVADLMHWCRRGHIWTICICCSDIYDHVHAGQRCVAVHDSHLPLYLPQNAALSTSSVIMC